MTKREKIEFLKAHEDSYVRLVYQFHDGTTSEKFGHVYVSKNTDTVTLSGEWVDFDILALIEIRDAEIISFGELRAAMNTQQTKQQVSAALQMTAAIADAIRELGTVPAGVLYANLMSKINIQQFDAIIRILVKAELVSNVAHELKWIGRDEFKSVGATGIMQ